MAIRLTNRVPRPNSGTPERHYHYGGAVEAPPPERSATLRADPDLTAQTARAAATVVVLLQADPARTAWFVRPRNVLAFGVPFPLRSGAASDTAFRGV